MKKTFKRDLKYSEILFKNIWFVIIFFYNARNVLLIILLYESQNFDANETKSILKYAHAQISRQ